jgi:hypothetical protein
MKKLNHKERALVKDEAGFLHKAVEENLEHFRAMDVTDSAAAIAEKYKLSGVDTNLREITYSNTDDLPGIIVALDQDGNFAGSFFNL